MNLSMDALRWLTVKALRGRTWAGLRVYDSPADASDLREPGDQAPFVAVYIDDGNFTLDNNSLHDQGGRVMLIIECAVAAELSRTTPAPSDPPVDADPSDPDIDRAPGMPPAVALAATDEALEATIGFIARQCLSALTDPDNHWAELWRVLATERLRVEVRRGGTGMDAGKVNAFRAASRVMRIEIGVLGEPARGTALPADGFWSRFLLACEADQELGDLAKIIRQHLEADSGEADWRRAQRVETWTEAGVRGVGLAPPRTDMEDTPVLSEVIPQHG